MITDADFLTEAIARADEHEDDFDARSGFVFGVVYFNQHLAPVAIDVYRGPSDNDTIAGKQVRRGAEAMVDKFGYETYELVPFGRLTENRSKASLIRETALRAAG